MSIGKRIKEIRLEKGMTQKELAEKCGMFDSALRRIENGKQNPKIETIERIIEALNIPFTDIIDDDELRLSVNKHFKETEQILDAVENFFSQDTKYALCLYESLKQKNKIKVVGYMERLFEEEKEEILYTPDEE